MTTVTTEDIQRIAHLAHLTLTPHEAEAMTEHVSTILTYVEKLNAVPTEAVDPATHAVTIAAPLREDQVTNTPDPTLLRTAPAHRDTFFSVPKVIE